MAYPPANLSPRSDSSPAVPSSHAADHTAERNAINAIVAALGSNPMGAHATVEARLAAIEAALTSLGYTGDGSGGSGGTGGGGTGGGGSTPTTTQTQTSLASVSYPLDVTTLGVPGSYLDNNGNYTRGWFSVRLGSGGLYENTLIVFTVINGATKTVAINLDNPAQSKVFGADNYGPWGNDQFIEAGGKVINITGAGWSWDPSVPGSDWTHLNTYQYNQSYTVPGNYIRLQTSWVWASALDVMQLDDSTGAVTKRLSLPNAGFGAADYLCNSYAFSDNGCWVVMRKNSPASGDTDVWKVYRYNITENTLELRATAAENGVPLPLSGGGYKGIGTVLADGRLLGAGSDGVLRSVNNMIVPATHGQFWDPATESVPSYFLASPMNGWLLAVVRNTTNGTWSIRAATDTKVVTLVGPITSPISHLHWNPELEGLVLRWTEGTTLKRSSFSVLEENH